MRMRMLLTLLTNTILSACIGLALSATDLQAATLTVTKTADTNDGACNNDCSLREAIAAANPGGGDEVVFASPLFDSPQTITLSEAVGFRSLVIEKSLTITGRGANLLTIRRAPSATAQFRILEIGRATVQLSGMTITGGNVSGGGGGIFVFSSTLTVTRCHITGNTASEAGGGIRIDEDASAGSVVNITDSTISNNTANYLSTAGGGGIHNDKGELTITNSTISGNVKNNSNNNGGGIWTSVSAFIDNSTITDNQAAGAASAGGVFRQDGTATIRSSIVAANRNNNSVADTVANNGSFTSGGYNLIGSTASGSGFTDGVNNDRVGTVSSPLNPRLDALAIYGGAIPTHRLQQSPVLSPAIDKGNSFGLRRDQRDSVRPVDNINVPNASSGDGSDIGAYEASATLIVTNPADTTVGACDSDCTLREAITAAGTGNTIEFSSLFDTPQTITLSEAAGFRTLTISDKSLSIAGKGAHLLAIRRDPASGVNFGVFSLSSTAVSGSSVALSGMTITGGFSSNDAGGINAVRTDLTLTSCHITGNSNGVGNGDGGGVTVRGGSSLTILNSTISNNSVLSANAVNSGGGISFTGNQFVMTNSTVSGNVVNGGGGNSGGLILSLASGTITSSTITDNQAETAGGVLGDANATVRNTIIAGNRNNSSVPDVGGSFTSGGFNLIGNVGSVTGFNQPSDQNGSSSAPLDPLLVALALNDGTTPTHALRIGSPALDAGNAFGQFNDQRAVTRPIDNPGAPPAPGGDNSDIGAFESPRFAPLVVTKTADTNDGACDSDCSLREAIGAASTNGSEIIFSSLFDMPQTITLSDAAGFRTLTISDKSLSIAGKGAHLLTIRRDPASSVNFGVFSLSSTAVSGSAVALSGMTITGGFSSNDAGGINAVRTDLTLTSCHITGNSNGVGNGDGGGITARGGSSLTILNSTISNNSVLSANAVNSGGGISFTGNQFVMTNSTVSGNVVNGGGGNSGGLILSLASGTITSSTITDNQADGTDTAGGLNGSTGATVRNTIIAGNRNNSSVPDVRGSVTSGSFNLVGSALSSSGFTDGVKNDRVGTLSSPLNPLLDALGNYGGNTPTHRLQSGSPAIDAGNSFDLITDQRGATRPVDTPSVANAAGDVADIGAFEAQTATSNQPPVANPDSYTVSKNNASIVAASGVLSNDTDADSVSLSAIKVSDPLHGTLTLNSNGSFTYTPAANYTGADSFTYKANDGTADSNVVTVTLTILNAAPAAVEDSYSTTRNAPLILDAPGVLSNDTDANGDSLTAIKVSDPAHGSLTLNSNGGFTYTPTANYVGPDSFTYKANDGTVDSNVASVTLMVNPGASQTLTVTKTTDTNDGVCDADCSLREAIVVSQTGDTIVFSSLFDSTQVITLSPGISLRDLVIDSNVTITGKGANLLTIDGAAAGFRIFNVNGAGVVVSLNGMTISGGNAFGDGGGINVNNGATLNVSGCHIRDNLAVRGGGIYVAGDSALHLADSTVSGNTADADDGAGAGIHNEGLLTVTNSTISGNVKSNGSDNGGGIWSGGTATLSSVTVTDNESIEIGGASGIYRAGGAFTIRNSIIAGNRNNSARPDVIGEFTSEGYNLVGNVGTASGFTQIGDQSGTASTPLNPQLSALAPNGGTTPSHALQAGSSAIDKGKNFGLITDQRGQARPVDDTSIAPASGGDNSDIGAYESQQEGCTALNLSPSTLPDGTTGTSYNQTITASGGVAPYTFAVTSGALPDGLTLSTDGTVSGTPSATGTFNFTITATGANNCAASQAYTVTINSSTITFSPTSLPSGTVNATYQMTTITPAGGAAPYSFAVTGLPDGLSFTTTTTDVTIGGTPTQAGVFTVSVTATDASGRSGSIVYTLVINLNGNTPGTLLISEIRTSGPAGSNDEFVELYNNSDAPLSIAGFALAKMGTTCASAPVIVAIIPAGTSIPARGHYLVTGAAYSLPATGDLVLSSAATIGDDTNIGFFNTSETSNFSPTTRLDAVGFSTNTGNYCDLLREGANLAGSVGSTSEHSFVRDLTTGTPKDTGDNAADFRLVSTTPATPVGNNMTPTLGSPGPENLSSHVQRNGMIKASLIDPTVASTASPNRIRSAAGVNPTNAAYGTLDIRRKFTNRTGVPVTALRFRVVDVTTRTGANAPPAGTADLRLLSSIDTDANGGAIIIKGTTLDAPTQADGGGFNSSATVALPGGSLAPGASINVRFLLGVQQGGSFRFLTNVEALMDSTGEAATETGRMKAAGHGKQK